MFTILQNEAIHRYVKRCSQNAYVTGQRKVFIGGFRLTSFVTLITQNGHANDIFGLITPADITCCYGEITNDIKYYQYFVMIHFKRKKAFVLLE